MHTIYCVTVSLSLSLSQKWGRFLLTMGAFSSRDRPKCGCRSFSSERHLLSRWLRLLVLPPAVTLSLSLSLLSLSLSCTQFIVWLSLSPSDVWEFAPNSLIFFVQAEFRPAYLDFIRTVAELHRTALPNYNRFCSSLSMWPASPLLVTVWDASDDLVFFICLKLHFFYCVSIFPRWFFSWFYVLAINLFHRLKF